MMPRMMTSFCVYGTSYRDVGIAGLQGLLNSGYTLLEPVECTPYLIDKDDYDDKTFITIDTSLATVEEQERKMQTQLQQLVPHTLIAARFEVPFTSRKEEITFSVRPIDPLSCGVIIGGDYDTLVEDVPEQIAEQNMRTFAHVGMVVYNHVHPIYGVQSPYIPIIGLQELLETNEALPLDWTFFGPGIMRQLQRDVSLFHNAIWVEYFLDGGVFFAFADWMDYGRDPQTSPSMEKLCEALQTHLDWKKMTF
ncbi:hypothetical protein [Dictyobacter kobayashii]|uniref:Uncharacterized protein n=1 Tax=Dictyobacter kobayashii TaxID=2014872 RepID=A0A402AVR2_9CHLR|nr:hypothetical protein [Dictyobacter kobayashii]GCE23198.1 hypothetical protein KDK_69980 [Dictyobacter kobayashii]